MKRRRPFHLNAWNVYIKRRSIEIFNKENDFALWLNGFEVATDSIGITFPNNTLNQLRFEDGNGDLDFYKMNCTSDSDFWTDFYPKLVDLQKKGTQVVIVVGDTGWDKGRKVTSPEGITFLSSGINNSYQRAKNKNKSKITYNNDRILEFTLNPSNNSLIWKFIMLDSLDFHR